MSLGSGSEAEEPGAESNAIVMSIQNHFCPGAMYERRAEGREEGAVGEGFYLLDRRSD